MKITKLYYFPLMVDSAVPITDETLIGEYTRLDPARLRPVEAKQIEGVLTSKYSRICAGKYTTWLARIRVEFDGGKKIVLVDAKGCVKSGREQYFIYPGDFVWLYDTLQRHLNTQKPDWPRS